MKYLLPLFFWTAVLGGVSGAQAESPVKNVKDIKVKFLKKIESSPAILGKTDSTEGILKTSITCSLETKFATPSAGEELHVNSQFSGKFSERVSGQYNDGSNTYLYSSTIEGIVRFHETTFSGAALEPRGGSNLYNDYFLSKTDIVCNKIFYSDDNQAFESRSGDITLEEILETIEKTGAVKTTVIE